MKPDAYRGPPLSEGAFRDFVTRLIDVPKAVIDEREAARKAALSRKRARVNVAVDKPKTEG